jgi:hypothetical protein
VNQTEQLDWEGTSHHWEIPRDQYPEGRDGYLRWRTHLKRHHARVAAGVRRESCFPRAILLPARAPPAP